MAKSVRKYGPPVTASPTLTNEQVNVIRFLTKGTVREIAEQYGVSTNVIDDIFHDRGKYKDVPVTSPPAPKASK